MLTAENWCIKIDEKIYGPYTTPQMRKFAHEGRLAAWSMVSPAGGRSWRPAREENTFASFFGYEPKSNGKKQRAFGKREANDDPAEASQNNAQSETKAPTNANFILIFDVVSGAASRVEAAIASLGNAFPLASNVWSVKCNLTAVGVRNSIAPYLSKTESIFVVDASRGKTSWQNYPPGPHSKISAAYVAPRSE